MYAWDGTRERPRGDWGMFPGKPLEKCHRRRMRNNGYTIEMSDDGVCTEKLLFTDAYVL